MKVLNFGSLNIDYVYQVENFVKPKETISSISMDKFCGGKGLNQSIALARAGAETYHAGAVGADDGDMLLSVLKKSNVSVEFIEKRECSSGHAIIQVDRKGQNCILLFGGANQTINEEQINKVLSHFSQGDYLVLQNEVNMVGYIMQQAHAKGMKIILNPAPMNEKILDLPLNYVDYFILNEVEARGLCCAEDDEKALIALHEKFPDAAIVLTLGEKGSLYIDKDTDILAQPVFDVPVVDTVAAGDTFTGYFIASIANGKQVKEALIMATKASSIAVTIEGAEPSIPDLEKVLSYKF